jgi:hypothetical protein
MRPHAPPPTRSGRTARAVFVLGVVAACRHGSSGPVDRTGPAVIVGPEHVALGSGVDYHDTTCATAAGPVRLRTLLLRPGEGASLRALRNVTAARDRRCLQRYGGSDLRILVAVTPGFRVLGAANGNFFHEWPPGFRANGMIWSSEGVNGGRWMAPLQPTADSDCRGDRVVVVDDEGGHEVQVATGRCEPGACRASFVTARFARPSAFAVLAGGREPRDEGAFLGALRSAFPRMTFAMQLTPAYDDATPGAAARGSPSPSS